MLTAVNVPSGAASPWWGAAVLINEGLPLPDSGAFFRLRCWPDHHHRKTPQHGQSMFICDGRSPMMDAVVMRGAFTSTSAWSPWLRYIEEKWLGVRLE